MAQIKIKKSKNTFIIEPFSEVRRNIIKYFSRASIILFLSFAFAIFSPILWLFSMFLLFLLFYLQVWSRYFNTLTAVSYYIGEFSCAGADNGIKVFSKFGYKIDYDEEWDLHKAKLKDYDVPEDATNAQLEDFAENLAKEVKRVKNKQPYREFGIGKDQMCRHFLFLGTTGAGKTETLMSWFADVLDIRNSGNVIFIDGKGDAKMHAKLSALIAQKNRETSSYTINFLKQEKMSTSNTYNSILTMSPYKGVSFMGSLLPSGGEGNADYFKNRGIAMLTLPLAGLRIRNEFFGEPFSLSLLQNSTSTLNISILFCLFYGFVREENERIEGLIKSDKAVRRLWNEAKDKSTAINQDMEFYEKILNYVTQYKPSAKVEVESFLGYDFRLFFMSYNMVFKLCRMYMAEISLDWAEMTEAVAEALYVHATIVKRQKFSVIDINPVSLENIRRWFEELKTENVLNEVMNKGDFKQNQKKGSTLKSALGVTENAKATLSRLPETAVQQHAYSQQQWTNLFQVFERFPHIFGSPFPDIDMKDIIKNNKSLYVILPVLELGEDMGKLLGKMFIRDMQESGSVSLGGENLLITPKQRAVYVDKITPKPLTLFCADEYGYYRVDGGAMSIILAQFRSLNIGAILSLQDVAGLGSDEETQKALANTSKFVLKSYDTKIRDFVEQQLSEEDVMEVQQYLNSERKIVEAVGENITVKREKSFDISMLSDLSYGCGVYLSNSKPIIVQSYFFGGDEVEPYVVSMERYSLV